jgi:hypothetical protein
MLNCGSCNVMLYTSTLEFRIVAAIKIGSVLSFRPMINYQHSNKHPTCIFTVRITPKDGGRFLLRNTGTKHHGVTLHVHYV